MAGEPLRRAAPGGRALVGALLGAGVLVAATSGPLDPAHAADDALFRTSDGCLACHNGVRDARGEDVSIGSDWRATMMANSARDPYWQASVRRELMDHPAEAAAIEDECATCHMPMARYLERADGRAGQVFANLPVGASAAPRAAFAADGVSCSVCHRISAEGLGAPASFTGGFVVDTARDGAAHRVFGPFEVDSGRARLMRSAAGFAPTEGGHVQTSELCGSCHVLMTRAAGGGGGDREVLPEQTPYLEWTNSAFREERTCQSCHMPVVEGDAPVSSVLGRARADVSRHVFRGGNFLMLRMLARHREELGVAAPAAELEASALRTEGHLRSETARLTLDAASLGPRSSPSTSSSRTSPGTSCRPRIRRGARGCASWCATRAAACSSSPAGCDRTGRSPATTATQTPRASSRTTSRSTTRPRCRSTRA